MSSEVHVWPGGVGALVIAVAGAFAATSWFMGGPSLTEMASPLILDVGENSRLAFAIEGAPVVEALALYLGLAFSKDLLEAALARVVGAYVALQGRGPFVWRWAIVPASWLLRLSALWVVWGWAEASMSSGTAVDVGTDGRRAVELAMESIRSVVVWWGLVPASIIEWVLWSWPRACEPEEFLKMSVPSPSSQDPVDGGRAGMSNTAVPSDRGMPGGTLVG